MRQCANNQILTKKLLTLPTPNKPNRSEAKIPLKAGDQRLKTKDHPIISPYLIQSQSFPPGTTTPVTLFSPAAGIVLFR